MQTWTNRKHIRRIDHALPRWDWQDPIDEWMRWQLAVGRSKETLRTRWYQLERFSRITDKPIRDVTADDVIGYFILAEERESGTSLSTKRGVRTSLNAFYKWCIKRGIAERNPIDDVPVIPLGVPAGLICPEHAIDEAIKSEDDMTVDMVMLGAWMGLRRIEIASIDLAQDIEDNPDEMRLRVHGKGRKERVLPVPGELARRLSRTRCAGGSRPSPTIARAATSCWSARCSDTPPSAPRCTTSVSTRSRCGRPSNPSPGPTRSPTSPRRPRRDGTSRPRSRRPRRPRSRCSPPRLPNTRSAEAGRHERTSSRPRDGTEAGISHGGPRAHATGPGASADQLTVEPRLFRCSPSRCRSIRPIGARHT